MLFAEPVVSQWLQFFKKNSGLLHADGPAVATTRFSRSSSSRSLQQATVEQTLAVLTELTTIHQSLTALATQVAAIQASVSQDDVFGTLVWWLGCIPVSIVL